MSVRYNTLLFYAIENGLNFFWLCHHPDIEFLSLIQVNANNLPIFIANM